MTLLALVTITLALNAARPANPSAVEATAAADKCQYPTAQKLLKRLPSNVKTTPEAMFLDARVSVQLDNSARAVVVLEKLRTMKVAPKLRLNVLLELAGALSNIHRNRAALAVLDTARESGADSGLLASMRAVILIAMGKKDEGRDLLVDTLERDSHLAGAWFNLGCLEAEDGDEYAISYIRRSWSEGLRDPGAMKKEPKLRNLLRRHLLDEFLRTPASEWRCNGF